MQKIMFSNKYGLTDAVLQGRKTMTRRIIPFDIRNATDWKAFEEGEMKCYGTGEGDWVDIRRLAKYKVGEVVAVAQSYKSIHEEMMNGDYGNSRYDAFRCAMVAGTKGWGNKTFVRADLMPHQIRITDIKVEHLQDISEEDAMREGVFKYDEPPLHHEMDLYAPWPPFVRPYKHDGDNLKYRSKARYAFAYLINKVSGRGTWEENPYVFVYTFKLIK